jgi:hypothetical protein
MIAKNWLTLSLRQPLIAALVAAGLFAPAAARAQSYGDWQVVVNTHTQLEGDEWLGDGKTLCYEDAVVSQWNGSSWATPWQDYQVTMSASGSAQLWSNPDSEATSFTLPGYAGQSTTEIAWAGYNVHSGDVNITLMASAGGASDQKVKTMKHAHAGHPPVGLEGEHAYVLKPQDKRTNVPANTNAVNHKRAEAG